VDISEIRKLIKLIQNTDVTEIEVSEGEHSVRISRQQNVTMAAPVAPQMFAAPSAPVAAATPAAPAAADAAPSEEHLVKSPMVGTFYRAPAPDADSFVSEGQRIKKGDILCIIEAMKLMNEIEAEYDGIVESILVENASPLEYGQPMFVITPL